MHGYVRLPRHISSIIRDHKELRVYAVISAMSFAADRHTGYVQVSMTALAKHAGLSEAGAKRAVGTLCARGILHRSRTFYDGRRQSNRYRLTPEKLGRYILLDLSLLTTYEGDKLLVYLGLCRHTDRRGRCYCSERCLAVELGVSRNTVRKYAAELEADGALVRYARYYKKNKQTKARRSFAYHIGHTGRTPCMDKPPAPVRIRRPVFRPLLQGGGSNLTHIYNPQEYFRNKKKRTSLNTLYNYTRARLKSTRWDPLRRFWRRLRSWAVSTQDEGGQRGKPPLSVIPSRDTDDRRCKPPPHGRRIHTRSIPSSRGRLTCLSFLSEQGEPKRERHPAGKEVHHGDF